MRNRAPLAWLKTHTERVPTTNAKAIELNSRLCLTVLHSPAWLAPALVYALSAQLCAVCVRLCAFVWECQRVRERERAQISKWVAGGSALSTVYWAHFLSCCPMSVQCWACVCVCVCVRVSVCVCVYTWWRETGLITFLACYFLYKGSYKHMYICMYIRMYLPCMHN